MFKRIVSSLLVLVMLINFVPMLTVYAFNSYKVEVTKSSAPIRDGYYESKDVIRWAKQGEILTIVGEKRNLKLNLWYKVEGGGYIYSGNVKKTHDHKIVFNKYEDVHPHYAEYRCKHCLNGAYCSTETKKQSGCKECYPYDHDHKIVFNKYGTLHPHYAEYKCKYCVNGAYCSQDTQKQSGCKECYPYDHDHKIVFNKYGTLHPHYAEYKCKYCNEGAYCSQDTQKQSGCEECFPYGHDHNIVFAGYSSLHPHYAEYKCKYCLNGAYCSTETKKQSGCEECFTHEHKVVFDKYGALHPHYAEYKCKYCVNGAYCSAETQKQANCEECNAHSHDFKFSSYEDVHPHYAVYVCECGDVKATTETQRRTNCSKCNTFASDVNSSSSDHIHDYKLDSYSRNHPHYAKYLCECGEGYFENQKAKVLTCATCFPDSYILENNSLGSNNGSENHVCEYEFLSTNIMPHPHAACFECPICKARYVDYNFRVVDDSCLQCKKDSFKQVDLYPSRDLVLYTVDSDVVRYASVELKNEVFSAMDALHLGLSVCGIIPVYGAVCDGLDVAIYLVEGKYVDAVASGMSFIPITGFVTGTGKVIKKSSIIVAEGVTKAISRAAKKNIVEKVIEKTSLSIYSQVALKYYSQFSDEILENIVKISKNADMSVYNALDEGNTLISSAYKGTLTGTSGIRYTPGSEEGHRLIHVLEGHSKSMYDSKAVKDTFFNVDGTDVLEIIDEGFSKTPYFKTIQNNGRELLEYDMGRVIGMNGETKLRIILEGNTQNIVTAFPIK